ncbi:OLC1v1002598C1 [Oldenlandia corymbosa var. corymbosa]|uniref:OLC1v1002598C1 n=1 Tax=Oldenlandia corymbosa var. corymbosa TaxID=529605 RepID=A0AAV1D976_OLDCO|nr:OLC1v1002598C1 [Oldenlandia corymbosa var. corymbosa]
MDWYKDMGWYNDREHDYDDGIDDRVGKTLLSAKRTNANESYRLIGKIASFSPPMILSVRSEGWLKFPYRATIMMIAHEKMWNLKGIDSPPPAHAFTISI